jgi:hypothetical protein
MSHKINTLAAIFILCGSTTIYAQLDPANQKFNDNPSGTTSQPQGKTGPINTMSGGAPAASPQGDTPAGMQAAPNGSSATIRSDKNDIVEGTPKK